MLRHVLKDRPELAAPLASVETARQATVDTHGRHGPASAGRAASASSVGCKNGNGQSAGSIRNNCSGPPMKKARIAAGLTQEELAAKAGLL